MRVMEYWSVGCCRSGPLTPSLHYPISIFTLLHQVLNQERPHLSRVGEHFSIDAVFVRFAPGFVFGIGTAGEMAEVRFVRADSYTVAVAAVGICRPEPLVNDFNQGRNILHVVTRHPAAD